MVDDRHSPGPIRCAIYTRKSTEEGLEQNFNSLDAQREACAAYILSQRHEGWCALPEIYEDGGYSGGNMDRPGLKRLLAAVAAGDVDVIVVYKVDRLTRSLTDFARIVDVLDARRASFVSVTQSFNSTNSMGRLTLNVLLSFAQFEREVTAERIRDKVAASKAKGMWMGGLPPLGYDVKDRELIINREEAEAVRCIFTRYVELQSAMAVVADLNIRGIRSKARTGRDGRAYGGIKIGRGNLYAMLRNRLYVGEIVHKDRRYPGRHAAIVDIALFERVQAILDGNQVGRPQGGRTTLPSLLAGLLFDDVGRPMSPSHSTKHRVHYRYYVSQHATAEDLATPKSRISAPDIECGVIQLIKISLNDAVQSSIASGKLTPAEIERLQDTDRDVGKQLDHASLHDRRELVRSLVSRIVVTADHLSITLTIGRADPALGDIPMTVSMPVESIRAGRALRLVLPQVESDANEARAKPALIKLVTQAMAVRETMERGRFGNIEALAKASGYGHEHAMDLLRIAYLAPHITAAILAGRQPESLNRSKLIRWPAVPLKWADQCKLLGFA